MFLGKLCNLHIEAGVVYEDYYIGIKGKDIFAALLHIAQYLPDVGHHLHKAHYGVLSVILNHLCTGLAHKLASPGAYLRRWILFQKSLNKVGAVKVSRCLSGNYIVLHNNSLAVRFI